MSSGLPSGDTVEDNFNDSDSECTNCYAFTFKTGTACYTYCTAEITAVATADDANDGF